MDTLNLAKRFPKILCITLLLFFTIPGNIQAQNNPAKQNKSGKVPQTEAQIRFYKQLSSANKVKKIKDNDSAAVYAKSLLDEAKKNNDPVWASQVNLAQSTRAFRSGDHKVALAFARQSAAEASETDSITYIKAPLMVAYMLNREGKDDAALAIAFKMLHKAEGHGWRELMIECKNCIADVYRKMNQPQRALPYAQQASDESLEIKDTAMYLFSTSMLSAIYSNRGMQTPENLAKATKLSEIVVSKTFFPTLSKFSQVRELGNLARLYEMQDKFAQAERILLQAVEISHKEGYRDLETHDLNELMTVKIDQGLYQEAINYGNRAVALLPDTTTIDVLSRNIYNRLKEAHLKLRNFELAFRYAEKARIINDSLVSADKIETAAKLDQDYKADKRIIQANTSELLMKQQRNYSITIAVIVLVGLIGIYRWFLYKRKRQADLVAEENRQLARLNDLKTKFFSNISHELRTPLTLIAGPIDQLRNVGPYELDPELKKNYIETVWQNSRKLLSLVNELLDLTKMESGKITVQNQSVALDAFLKVIFQGFDSAAKFKKINYSLLSQIKSNIVANLDKDKLEKILNNLISNAMKFTPANGSIKILAEVTSQELIVSVSDTGKGIPEADLKHIFDRYYQVTTADSPAEGGTGIGLAIAKEFTELLGGNIQVTSTLQKGTSFKITIPTELQEVFVVTQPEIQIPDEVLPTPPETAEKLGYILLVEDQHEMSAYIASILRPYYAVEFANNGLEALKLLEDANVAPALIISDVMMPEMDGFTLLNRLKTHEVFCRIPVVMLTALADPGSKLNALSIGVDDYVTKPFVSNELLARVRNLVANASERLKYAEDDTRAVEESGVAADVAYVSPSDLAWLKKLEALVRENTGKIDVDLASVSYTMAVSERQLFRNIKRLTGLTPNKYIRSIRLQIAREAIESGKYRTIAEISYVAGFETPAYFSKLFKEAFGKDVADLL
ncbi:ATP-binding protein [Pedobacter duraquae]|uniref:histidine kinase n=1 Tax=Pedobacter duraquae TaxID=425511 RepID=A0A4R6IQ39_9SPHI|nr:ATP-binding protein [Pedobacter duraquae]TDO24307.1 phospho-acceptor domain-containing protein [Pedobacter duraquae]